MSKITSNKMLAIDGSGSGRAGYEAELRGMAVRRVPPNGRAGWLGALFLFLVIALGLPVEAAAPPSSGMKLWLRSGSGVTLDGSGGVITWADQSGNGNDATQSVSGGRPTVVGGALNGESVVRFAGGQFLDLTNFLSGATRGEVAIVLRTSSASNNSGLWRFGTGAGGDWHSLSNGDVYDGFGSNARYWEGRPSQDITQYHLYGVSSQPGLWRSWMNGVPFYRSDTNTVAFTTAPRLGYNTDGGTFVGDIAEVIIYDRILTDEERQETAKYLTQRFGLRSDPETPTDVTVRKVGPSQNLVTWTWAQTNSAVAFEVERKSSGGSFAVIAEGLGAATYLDNGVGGGAYTYRVRAVNANGKSSYSDDAILVQPMAEGGDVSVSGLKLWLMADGAWQSPVGYLADYSGEHNDAWQTGYTQRPTLQSGVLNGKPVLNFNAAAGQFLRLPEFLSTATAGHVVVVLRATSAAVDSGLWAFGNGGYWQSDFYSHSNGTINNGFGSTVTHDEGKPTQDITQFNVYEASSETGLWQSWMNGVPLFRTTTNVVGFRYGPLLGVTDYGSCFHGDIAEILVYNRALSDAERRAIGTYLNQKYALQSVPPVPAGLSVRQLAPTQNLVTWNWSPTNSRETFVIERMTGTGGTFAEVGRVTGQGTYLDGTIVDGVQYTYRVRAVNGRGSSDYTSEVAAYQPMAEGGAVAVTGLKLWMMADGAWESPVGHWKDYSGNGNDAWQSTYSRKPTLAGNAANGKPAVHFDASFGQSLGLPNFLSAATAGHVVVVLRALNTTTTSGIWNFGSGGSWQRDYYTAGDGAIGNGFGSTVTHYEGRPSQDVTQFHVYEADSQAGLWQSWIDGVPLFKTTTNVVGFNGAPVLGGNSGGDGFHGEIAEILIYDRTISDSERKSVSTYLMQKYALRETPQTPTGLKVVQFDPTQNSISWNWTQTNSQITFIIERKTGVGGTYAEVARVDGRGTYLDQAIVAGEQYFYRVRAVNSSGGSSPTSEVAVYLPMAEGGAVAVSGLKLWMMADGAWESPVGYWKDYSGNGNDAWQSTYSRKPTLAGNALNGKPAVHFEAGFAQNLGLPNFLSAATAGHVVVVLRALNTTTTSGIWNFGSGGSWQRDYYTAGDGAIGNGFGSTITHYEGRPSQDVTQFHVYEADSQAGLWQSWIDGVPLFKTTSNVVGFNAAPVLGGNSGGDGFHGEIAEILIYDRTLSEVERKSVSAYLTQKYALRQPPQAPAGLKVVQLDPTQNLVSWNWNPTDSQVTFIIERKTGTGGAYVEVARVNGRGTYLDSSVVAGQEYFYRVRAVDASGASSPTSEVTVYLPMAEGGTVALSGMKLWMMADGAWENPVGYWRDYSGSGSDAWQNTFSRKPALIPNTLNGKPVLRFDSGLGQVLYPPDFLSAATAGHVVVVVRALNTTTASGLWYFGTGGYWNRDYYTAGDGTISNGFGSTVAYWEGRPSQDITQFHIYEADSQTGLWQSWIDGVPLFESTTNVVGFPSAPAIGGNSGGIGFHGEIAEILIYDRTLTDTEREGISTYLTQKYAFRSNPAMPTGVQAIVFNGDGALITWDAATTNASLNFHIWRRKNGGAWEKQGTTENLRTFVDSGLEANANYDYRIQAVDSAGASAFTSATALNRRLATTEAFPTTGLKLWMMADGAWESPVGYLADYSGNGNDAWQNVYSQKPTLELSTNSGKPAMHFNGTAGQMLALPNFLTGATAGHVLVVLRAANTTSRSGLWTFGSGGAWEMDHYTEFNGALSNAFGSTTSHYEGIPSAGIDITQFNIYEASSAAGLWKSWINGAPLFQTTTNTVGFTSAPLLGRNSYGSYFNGDIAEILVYNRTLTDEERRTLEHYLSLKYLLAYADLDNDGLTNGQEAAVGSNPVNPDTNGDGLFDGPSVSAGIDPTALDSDHDGLSNIQELLVGTNLFDADTDHDGVPDNLDYYPLDPTRSSAPPSTPGAPVITLTSPSGLILLP